MWGKINLRLFGTILFIIWVGIALGSFRYTGNIATTLDRIEKHITTPTISVSEPVDIEIPHEVYWALQDLWTSHEQLTQIINENRYQLDMYFYQIDDLYHQLDELKNQLEQSQWN